MADDAKHQDIYYIAEDMLATIRQRVVQKKKIFRRHIDALIFPADLADSTVLVPVDMRGLGEEFEDAAEMIAGLGPGATANAFIKAREFFEANTHKEPEGDRPKPMTVAEW